MNQIEWVKATAAAA